MKWAVFTELVTLFVLGYFACRAAYKTGWFLGWLIDPDQMPMIALGVILSVFHMGRDIDRLHSEVMEFTTVWRCMAVPPKAA